MTWYQQVTTSPLLQLPSGDWIDGSVPMFSWTTFAERYPNSRRSSGWPTPALR